MNRLRNIVGCLCPVLWLAVSQAQAATVVWSDSFETNAAKHWYSTGTWKIGSPTAGPATNALGYRTFSGTNCASTQGYSASGQDVRLVCTNYNGNSTLQVPPAGLSPRLRFWHWFNFANALGYVEISTNNGANWVQLSPTYPIINGEIFYSGGGVWSRASLDLSGYAGQNVQFAFHFNSGGSAGNGLGWFVDDVELDKDAPILNSPESFEAGIGDWSATFGGWEIGKPTGGPGAAHTGTNCMATKLSGSYANNVDTRLVSPPFLVPASGDPQLRFWHWYSFNNALGYVEINNGVVNGSSTTNVTITTNIVAVLDTNVYQLSGGIAGYSTPFYWNTNINAWTNGTKVIGSVRDVSQPLNSLGDYYYFEAGNLPLLTLGNGNEDYVSATLPVPQSTFAANFSALQGQTWTPTHGVGNAVGYLGTNFFFSYTTNTSTVFNQSSWTQISPTYQNPASSGGWTNESLDLSNYEGQVVEIAFHFTSGGQNTAPGWFVDDVSLAGTPLLAVPTNQTIYSGQTFSVAVSATNTLLPGATYTFSLLPSSPAMLITNNRPLGATLVWTNTGIVNGMLTWTNTAAAPGTYTIAVAAADNSTPQLTTSNSFGLTILPPPAPTLTVPAAPAIYASQTLTVTNYATNSVLPNAQYSYQLLSAPAGASISGGVVTWPTSLNQPTGTNLFIVAVTDNSSPSLSTNNSFVVTVTNPWMPTLTVPPNQFFFAGQTMVVTNYATNNFLPGDTFNFALLSPALTNMDLSQLTNAGVLRWAIPITQPPGTYTNIIQVTDNDSSYSTSGSFLVVITNAPEPVLTLPPTQFIYAGSILDLKGISATNSAFPNAIYNYRVTNSPAGVSIALPTGELTWVTAATNTPSLATISVVATDNHMPPLSVGGSFLVGISPTPATPAPVLKNASIRTNGGKTFTFSINSPWTNAAWQVVAATNLDTTNSNWVPIYTNGTSGSLSFTDLLATNILQRYYRVIMP